MPESQRITIRLPAKLLTAVEKAAAKQSLRVSDYLRGLCEQATGVDAGDMPQGFAAMDAETLAEATSAGGTAANKARWGKRKRRKPS